MLVLDPPSGIRVEVRSNTCESQRWQIYLPRISSKNRTPLLLIIVSSSDQEDMPSKRTPRYHQAYQNRSSCQSSLSLIVNTTVVFALILFIGVGDPASSLPPNSISSSSTSPLLFSLFPPYTSVLWFQTLPLPLWMLGKLLSCSLLKLRSGWLLVPLRHEEVGYVSGSAGLGLWEPPQTTRTKSGRREGMQADTTAIEGSAAVQMEPET